MRSPLTTKKMKSSPLRRRFLHVPQPSSLPSISVFRGGSSWRCELVPYLSHFLVYMVILIRTQVIDISSPHEHPSTAEDDDAIERPTPLFTFDPEWLAITRAFHPWFSTARLQKPFPEETEARELVRKELDWVKDNVNGDSLLVARCQQFIPTAPGPGNEGSAKYQQRTSIAPLCSHFVFDVLNVVIFFVPLFSTLVHQSANGSIMCHVGNREQGESAATWCWS